MGALTLTRTQRRSERDVDSSARRPLGALGKHATGAVEMDGNDREPAVHTQVGSAAAEGLRPAIGAAPALGEDDDAPSLVEQSTRLLQRTPVDAAALHGQ